MSDLPKYFAYQSAAERYALGRPFIHPLVVQKIVELTGKTRFESVLDVACGTGQSTRAIAEIADRVIGIDSSAGMLARATGEANIRFQQASAESLPFAEASFDLLTVGLAFHWFDQHQFLNEACRVLRDSGWLVIYNSAFLGELREEPAFGLWFRDVYLPQYPTPQRHKSVLSDDAARACRLKLVCKQSLSHDVRMTCDECVRFFVSQSNVAAVVEQGTEQLTAVAEYLRESLAPFFGNEPRTLPFQIEIATLQPQEPRTN